MRSKPQSCVLTTRCPRFSAERERDGLQIDFMESGRHHTRQTRRRAGVLSTPCFLMLAFCGIAPGQGYTIRTLAENATLSLSGSLAVDSAGNAYFATEDANAVFASMPLPAR